MAGKYDAKARSAHAKLKAKGGSGVMTVTVDTDDLITQQKTQTSTDYTFYALSTKLKSTRLREIAATLVERVTDAILMSAIGVPLPEATYPVTWRGQSWKIAGCDPLDPAADGAILYEVLLVR